MAVIGGAVALALAIAACGSDGDSGSSSNAAGKSTPAAKKPGGTFTYVYANLPTFTSIYCGMKIEAQKLGVKVQDAQSTEFTAASQSPVINAAVASKPSGLLISPADANASTAPLLKAKTAGIPVVAANTTVNNKDVLAAEALVDDQAAGRLAADTLAKLAGDRKGEVAITGLKPGAAKNADARREAFIEQLKQYPNLKFVGAQYYNAIDPSSLAAAANAVLSRYPKLLAFVGTSGTSTAGIATAMRQRHVKNVIGVGWEDGTPAANNALKEGIMKALMNYDNRQIGALALQQAVTAANGEPVEKVTLIKPVVLTTENPTDTGLEDCPM
jgi:ribose transport system substrate-binding protein